MRPRVFISRAIPQVGLDRLEGKVQAEVWPEELPPPYEVLREKARGVEGLLCLLTDRIDTALMEAAGDSLKVISQMAVGVDNIELEAATARGLPIGHTPGVLTEATADFTWALLMAAARRVTEADRYVRAGRWKTWGPRLLMGPDVAGATLGIIGLGRIGQAVARRARGFNMHLLYYDRTPKPEAEQALGAEFVPLEQLLCRADFVSLHTWLDQSTCHLMDEAQFRLMKPTAVLINASRGAIVNPEALCRALREGWIAYAALDVSEPEPIPMDSPLLKLDHLILSPHIASASLGARNRMASMAADNLLAGLRGERLPHCANPEVYER